MDEEQEQKLLEKHYISALEKCRANAVAEGNRGLVEDLDFIRDNMVVLLRHEFHFNTLSERNNPGLPSLFRKGERVTHFGFMGPKGRVAENLDTLEEICMHEIKHALLVVGDRKHDAMNSTWLKRNLEDAREIIEKNDGIVLRLALRPLDLLLQSVNRIEEFACDRFVSRNLPEASPEKIREQMYRDYFNGSGYPTAKIAQIREQNEKTSNLKLHIKDVFNHRSHPHIERRYRHLVTEQQKQQRKQPPQKITV